MKPRLRSARGLGLLEVLFSAALALLLSGTFATSISGALSGFSNIQSRTRLQIELRQALDGMLADFSQATEALSSYAGYTEDWTGAAPNDPATWILRLPAVRPGGGLLSANTIDDHIVYSYEPANRWVRRRVFPHPLSARASQNPDRIIANHMTAIAFSSPVPPDLHAKLHLVDMRLTASVARNGITYQAILTERAVYRNGS